MRPLAALLVVCGLQHLCGPFLAAVPPPRIASDIIMNQGMITAYLPFMVSGFKRSGLSMRTALTQLQVARLDASYISNKKHLFGKLRKIGMQCTHAADLSVTVRGTNGSVIQETMIWLDDDVIELKLKVGFFMQLAVEACRKFMLRLRRLPIIYIAPSF